MFNTMLLPVRQGNDRDAETVAKLRNNKQSWQEDFFL